MAKDPAFLFYYKDWLVSTRFMIPAERAYYFDLLCHQADMGSIPEDIIETIVPPEIWQKIRKKFLKDKQGFYNKTQREHLEKRHKFSESRRLNRIGKSKLVNNTSITLDNHMVNETVNVNEDERLNAVARDLLDNELKIDDEDCPF